MNLLQETLLILKKNGKQPSDVKWVGSENVYSTWEHFEKIANVEYDNGLGGQEVAKDLLVVGTNWWLERHEYDGSEWWEFKTVPKKPKVKTDFEKVSVGSWSSLEELNRTNDRP